MLLDDTVGDPDLFSRSHGSAIRGVCSCIFQRLLTKRGNNMTIWKSIEQLTWTNKDIWESEQQGWLLTYCVSSDYEGFQIECFDEAGIFNGDFEATCFVCDRAIIKDDPLAKKALAFIKDNNGRIYK